MKLHRIMSANCMIVLLLLGYSVPANAIALLLPAVQSARESPSAQPLVVTIDSLGSFEAVQNGDLPILTLDILGAGFDTTSAGDRADIPTGIGNVDLRSAAPLLRDGELFDVVINLYPPDPITPVNLAFTTAAISSDGNSANGELKGEYNFIVEVALISLLDPNVITTFLHADSLEIFGRWHSQGRNLVFDSPITASGMIDGDLAVVPLPAAAFLFLSGLFAIGLIGRRRQLFSQ